MFVQALKAYGDEWAEYADVLGSKIREALTKY